MDLGRDVLQILGKTNGDKVIISYARENQSIAESIYEVMKSVGIKVFADFNDIEGGDSVPDRISEATFIT